jgi:hypothetical protein
VIKVILYTENYNMDKWLKTGSLKRPHESNMTVSLKSTDCSPPEASTSTCSQSIKETTSTASTKKLSTYVRKYNTRLALFRVVAPCSLVEIYQRFRGPCCLHHQGALMMEAARSSETLVNFYQTTRRYNPEDSQPKIILPYICR